MRTAPPDRTEIPDGLRSDRLDTPFPMHRVRRVDAPTTKITGDVARFDEREHGFLRALRGDYGPVPRREFLRFVDKYPLSGAMKAVEHHLVAAVDGPVATTRAPLPDDPLILSRHIKETTLFLRADDVGICELPPYAAYSFDKNGEAVELGHTHAIAVLVDQGSHTFAACNGRDWISNSQSFRSYTATALISSMLAEYIRRLGYSAQAPPLHGLQGGGSPDPSPGRSGRDLPDRRHRSSSLHGAALQGRRRDDRPTPPPRQTDRFRLAGFLLEL